ncbi:MAG: GGDEF domain-containing protein [Oscillospiraceae bacterium]|nr:GGDEF domain-containing protein [Oscillospiraceae bacterium]
MIKDNFPVKVAAMMDAIEANVTANPELFHENCRELEEYAATNRNEYLKGFCAFYRGYRSYADAELEDSLAYLSEALNRLIAGEDWRLAAKTYNAMGNIADFQGDSSLAIDCYIKGLSLSREHELQNVEYDILCNIASIFIALGEPSQAVEMLTESERVRSRMGTIPIDSEIIVCANLCQAYLHLGRTEKAAQQLTQMKELCTGHESSINDISICILEAELYNSTGDISARDAAISRLANLKLSGMNVYNALTELYRHCMLLLEIGKLKEFIAMIDRVSFLVSGPTVDKQILELRLTYYEKVGDQTNYANTAAKYYAVARRNEKERNKIISHNIITRMRLVEEETRRKEVELSNLMLKQKSEHDALTGMNNRHKLNELSELAFHKAYHNGTPLTVEILDIDCYKEFNDNYGHQAGDECLIRIADAIRSMEEYNGVHTARYGGDEFVVIYEEYSRRDVERMAQRLQDRIYNLNIEHTHSKVSDRVTVSQGLFHKIPSGLNKPWDFLYGADMALYIVKNRGKNNYYIGYDFEDVRQEYRDVRTEAGKK